MGDQNESFAGIRDKIQIFHNAKRTKYNTKIQTKQNTKVTKYINTNTMKYKGTKYKLPKHKCNRIEMQQNTNVPKKCNKMQKDNFFANAPKYKFNKTQKKTRGQNAKRQNVIFCLLCILVFLYSFYLYIVPFVFCCICILLHLYFGNFYFVLSYLVMFLFCKLTNPKSKSKVQVQV